MTSMHQQVDTADYLRRMRCAPVYHVARQTPLEHAPLLSRRAGHTVLLKREDQQATFSFKVRGAYAMMARLGGDVLNHGVVAASAGNHAQGVALAAQVLGAPATIVVPTTASAIKVGAIRELGAEVIVHGDDFDGAYAHAEALATETGRALVPAFDHPEIIAGQGTIGLEMVAQATGRLDAVFVPVGGGGLIAGVAIAVKALSPGTRVIGVEPEDCDALARSFAAGHRVRMERVGTLADGVAVKQIGEEPYRICEALVDACITVTNDEVCAAVKEIFEDRRAIMEPSGAVGYAGLKRWAAASSDSGRSLATITTGANLNFDRLRHVAERAVVGECREAVVAVRIPEHPGSFLSLCDALGGHSLTEFNYRRASTAMASVFAGVRVRGREDIAQVLHDLERAGYEAHDLTSDEVAKSHVRHMVGGVFVNGGQEVFLDVELPERAGALPGFLQHVSPRWDISVFHYRNHGADRSSALVGLRVGRDERTDLHARLAASGFSWTDQTDNPAIRLFLTE